MYQQSSLLDCCYNPKLTVIRKDVRTPGLMPDLIKNADAILPLACLTGAPLCDRDPVTAQQVVCDAVKQVGDLASPRQIVVYPCTNSGYGVGEAGIHCTEETPLRPVSLYGRLKVDAEKHLLDKGCV